MPAPALIQMPLAGHPGHKHCRDIHYCAWGEVCCGHRGGEKPQLPGKPSDRVPAGGACFPGSGKAAQRQSRCFPPTKEMSQPSTFPERRVCQQSELVCLSHGYMPGMTAWSSSSPADCAVERFVVVKGVPKLT